MRCQPLLDLFQVLGRCFGDGHEGRSAKARKPEKAVGERLSRLAGDRIVGKVSEGKDTGDRPLFRRRRELEYSLVGRIEAYGLQELHGCSPIRAFERGDWHGSTR